MSGAGIEKAVGRRFGTRHDVAFDVVVTSGPSTFDFSTWRSGCYFSTLDFRLLDFEKLNEQRWNVYENKGPLWKTWGKSGNVIENKGSYASKAVMLLKSKVVSV
jgi:hypothetical protein